MEKIIFLEPIIDYKIWGGNRLKEFNFNFDFEKAGEAWIIACFKHKSNLIKNFKNMNLFNFFNEQKWFFNNFLKPYPLLTKILDANDDLSIQVHPDDEYANKHYQQFGKTESWFILECDTNNEIIYTHNAKNKSELTNLINQKRWHQLIKTIPIKKHDFFYVPAGTIHAIKKGTLVFELQQSSDITFRLYDYERLDKGKLRELHIQQAIDVINYFSINEIKKLTNSHDNYLIDNDFCKLIKIDNTNKKTYFFKDANWLQATVIEGIGKIDNYKIKKGDSFLIAYQHIFAVEGNLSLMISYV